MSLADVKPVFDSLRARMDRQRRECDRVDSWIRPELEKGFRVPRHASHEHRSLADLSTTPWLRLVVDNVVQAMYVDSIVGESGPSEALWSLWMGNGMSAQQVSAHRSMIAYGSAFMVVSRARGGFGEASSRIRCLSPRRVAVDWDDLGADPYPSAALEYVGVENKETRWILRLPGVEYTILEGKYDPNLEFKGLRIGQQVPTGLDFVPVVRMANQMDLDGHVVGEVTPFIPTAARINKTSFDRLLAQHFSSWKVKTVTGLELPESVGPDGEPTGKVDQDAADRMKVKLAQDDLLVAEDPDTRFGQLDATSLEPFVSAWRSDIEALAAVSQTPAHALTGQMVNLSAEALAAARAPLTQKVHERQMNAGVAYGRALRAAALMAGLVDEAEDEMVRVKWQDMEIRSMSQAVDALGKAATMLGIPKQALWGRIPGVESGDVQEWRAFAEDEAALDPFMVEINRRRESTIDGVSGGSDL